MEKTGKQYAWHPMPMHLHACYEPVRTATWHGASMESHMHMARSLGMRYIRFTDHDTRMGRRHAPADDFDFSRGELRCTDASGGWRSWELEGEPEVCFDGASMTLRASSDGADWQTAGAYFATSAKRHSFSLLADVTVEVCIEADLVGDAQLILDAQLSQRPPELTPAHLYYAAAGFESADPHAAVLPLAPDADGICRLHLTADAQAPGVGGQDNCFDTLRIMLRTRRGGRASVRLSSIRVLHRCDFDEVLCRQRALAEELAPRWGMKAFVTSEITGAGNHKVCFSSQVPAIDYAARGYRVTTMDAAAHVQRHNGLFAWNHPFVGNKGKSMTDAQRAEYLTGLAASMAASRLWGARLMEVGFPDGRAGFSIREHLRLWDLLSLAGLFITGYGDSDSHCSEEDGWYTGNNFATWTAAEAELPFPVPEEVFNASLCAGRAWFGDPVHMKGDVDFTCGGVPMGGIVKVFPGDGEKHMILRVTRVPAGAQLRIIVDGSEAAVIPVEGENLAYDFAVTPARPVSFARAELWMESRCIMGTNPIYLVKTDEFAGSIPEDRLYTEENL